MANGSFSGAGFSSVHRQRQLEIVAMDKLNKELKETMRTMQSLIATFGNDGAQLADAVNQLFQQVKTVNDTMVRFTKLTTGQIVANGQAAQHTADAYENQVRQLLTMIDQLRAANGQTGNAELTNTVNQLVTVFRDGERTVNHVAAAMENIRAAVPDSASLMSKLASSFGGNIRLNDRGEWVMRNNVTSPAADAALAVVNASNQRIVEETGQLLDDALSGEAWAPPASVNELSQRIDKAASEVAAMAQRIAVGDVDPALVDRLDQTLRRVKMDAKAAPKLNAPRNLKARFKEVTTTAESALSTVMDVKVDGVQTVDAVNVLVDQLNDFSMASLKALSLAVDGVVAGSLAVGKARKKQKTRGGRGLSVNTANLDKLVDMTMDVDGPRGAMVVDHAMRVMRQSREANAFLGRLGLGAGEQHRQADVDAAAQALTKVAASHISMNQLMGDRMWFGSGSKQEEKLLGAAGNSSTQLAATMTELLNMAADQKLETPALVKLREQRDMLLGTADKFGKSKKMMGEVQSAWAAARAGFLKAFTLLGTGLGFMGAGSLANAFSSPLKTIPGAVMSADAMLGMIRYRTAMTQASVGMDVDPVALAHLANMSRGLFAITNGQLGIDEAQQMYASVLEAGGPRGGTLAQRNADAMFATEQLVYMKAVGGVSTGSLQNAMKVFYHDAGESVRTVTSRLHRLTMVAQANGVPVEQMINSMTGITQAMREYGMTAGKVSGVVTSLVNDRKMRIENAVNLTSLMGRATASFGDNWGRSAFSHVAMGRTGSVFSTIRQNMMTHDENLKPIDEHYDNLVDQIFNIMDVTVNAHGGYGTSTGMMMADKQLREMGITDQAARSTMLSSLALGDKDALKAALKANDSGENELVPATQTFVERLTAAGEQLGVVDKLEAEYKMVTMDLAEHVESVFGTDLESIPELVDKMLGSMVTLVDWALERLNGLLGGDGLAARWLRSFAENPGSTGAATLAVGGLSMGALKYGARYGLQRLAQGAGRFASLMPKGAASGLSGKGAIGLGLLALTALGVGAYSLASDDSLAPNSDPPTDPAAGDDDLSFLDRFRRPSGTGEQKQEERKAAAQRRRSEWQRLLDSSRSVAMLREDAQIYTDAANTFAQVATNMGISQKDLMDVASKAFADHKRNINRADAITKEAWAKNFEYFLKMYGNINTAAEAASRRTFVDKDQFVQKALAKWKTSTITRANWFAELANKEQNPAKASLYANIAHYLYSVDSGNEAELQEQIQIIAALARGEGTEEGDDARAKMWNKQWEDWIKATGGQHSNSLGTATAEEIRQLLAWVTVNENEVQQRAYAEKEGAAAWRKAIAVPSANSGELDIRTVRSYTAEAIYEAFQRRNPNVTMDMVNTIVAEAQRAGIDPVFFAASLMYEGGAINNMGNVRASDGSFYSFSSFDAGIRESAETWAKEIHRAGTGDMWKVANIYAPQHESPGNAKYVPSVTSIMNEIYGNDLVNPGTNPITPGENSWIIADGDETRPVAPGFNPGLTGSGDLLEQGYMRWKDTGWAGITNGVEGCVEAVTKMGAGYSPWLAKQLENKNWGVAGLAQQAREDNLLEAYDPSRPMRRGDVAIWLNEDGEYWHANIADGAGGYYNNSSSRYRDDSVTSDFIQHFAAGEYSHSGNDVPAYIIRTGGGMAAVPAAGGALNTQASQKPQSMKEDMASQWAVYNANTGGTTASGVLVDNMRLARPGEAVDTLSQQLLSSEKALAESMARELSGPTEEEKEQVNWKDVVKVISDVVKEYSTEFSIVINGEVQEGV